MRDLETSYKQLKILALKKDYYQEYLATFIENLKYLEMDSKKIFEANQIGFFWIFECFSITSESVRKT
jgi:hypothetical protein